MDVAGVRRKHEMIHVYWFDDLGPYKEGSDTVFTYIIMQDLNLVPKTATSQNLQWCKNQRQNYLRLGSTILPQNLKILIKINWFGLG